MHDEGLKATLNLHPASGIQPWEAGVSCDGARHGHRSGDKEICTFRSTNKLWATNYFDLVLHPLEKQGIDFWWLDWQQQPNTKLPGVNNTWWLNYLHFTDQQREGKRPLLFHRWGGLGNHRYQIGFSGDTISSGSRWPFSPGSRQPRPMLATRTGATISAATCRARSIRSCIRAGCSSAGSVRFCARTPPRILTRSGASGRIPSHIPPSCAPHFKLRYAMQPYIYTEARRTYDTGLAFLRPLYYDWPEADAATPARTSMCSATR